MACQAVQMEHEDNSDNHQETSSIRSSTTVYSEIASSASVSSIASFPEYDLKPNMEIAEVKKRIAEHVSSRGQDLIQACKNFDRRNTGKIPRTQLRQVLRTFCFPITVAQFNALCSEANLNPGKINYIDFFNRISGEKSVTRTKPPEKISDNLPIDEVELRIKEKIKSKLYDVIRAFWLFDINKDGLIQKVELRRIIRNYCFDLSEDLFNDLWKTFDPKSTGLINYKEFLIKIGINADRYEKYMPAETVARALCWSDKKSKKFLEDVSSEQRCRRAAIENRDDPAIQGLPVEEVMSIFIDRLKRKAELLKKTFNLFDYEKNGEISVSDFRETIKFFVMPMSTGLFNEIWRRLNVPTTPDCKLYYQDFLNKFCTICSHTKDSNTRKAEKLDCYPIVQRIKNHVINPDARLRSVFTKINPDKGWQVTRQELKRAIEISLDFRMTEDEFKELTSILDPSNTNVINCLDFLQLFNKPCDDKFDGGESSFRKCCSHTKDSHTRKAEKLDGYPIVQRIQNHVNNPEARLRSVFTKINPDEGWQVTRQELKQAIEVSLDFRMTEDEFKELTSILDPSNTNVINCLDFLQLFNKPSDDKFDGGESSSTVDESESKDYSEYRGERLYNKIKHHLNKNKLSIEKALLVCDPSQSGFIPPAKLHNILNGLCIPLNYDQFKDLITDMKMYGDAINIKEFLDAFKKAPEEDTVKWISTINKLAPFKSRCNPELPFEEAEEMLKESVEARKTAMQKDFEALDVCNVGVTCKEDVRSVLNKFSFRYNDKQELWKKFPVNKYDQLVYMKFLDEYSKTNTQKKSSTRKRESKHYQKSCEDKSSTSSIYGEHTSSKSSVSSQGSKQSERKGSKVSFKQGGSKASGEKASKAGGEIRKSAKEILYETAPHLKPAFESMEPAVVRNFLSIRFHLRRADPKVTGTVDFKVLKNVLEKSGIFLSKEDQFHILEYFDSHLCGKINYRDFLRIFVWYA